MAPKPIQMNQAAQVKIALAAGVWTTVERGRGVIHEEQQDDIDSSISLQGWVE